MIYAILAAAIAYTCHSCMVQGEQSEKAESLPKITNKKDMKEALKGPNQIYAVLNAPVSGSAAKDEFGIFKEECLYIEYSGETIKASVYYPDDMGPQTSYNWESNNDIRVNWSKEVYLYDDIPFDFQGCGVDKADSLTEDTKIQLPKDSKAFVAKDINYYYPDGMGENPNSMEENVGLTRYDVRFLKNNTKLTFWAWIGDGEVSVYSSDGKNGEDDAYVLTRVYQNGDMSDLEYNMTSDEVGNVILLWIGVLFIIWILIWIWNIKDLNQ